jgi:hypothetical protein
MSQSIGNIVRNAPDGKNFYTTTAAATVDMDASMRNIIVDGSSGANEVVFVLPEPQEVPHGLPITFRLDGGTGSIKALHTGVTSFTASSDGDQIALISDGQNYKSI